MKPGYDRRRSRHTIVGLSDADWTRVLEAAHDADLGTWFPEYPIPEILELAWLTGAHPDVFARAAYYNLRVEIRAHGDQGSYVHVLWGRPKKDGIAGQMDLPVVRETNAAASWIPRVVDVLRKTRYTTRHLNRLCHRISEISGVPFSFRTIRHTCGIRKGRTGKPETVQFWLNCSATTALQYVRIASANDPRMLEVAEA